MADRNRKIFILPFKFIVAEVFFIDPEGAFSFYQLKQFTDSLVNSKGNKAMHMFIVSIDTVNINTLPFCILADMVENLFSYWWYKEGVPLLSGPYQMKPSFDVRHKKN